MQTRSWSPRAALSRRVGSASEFRRQDSLHQGTKGALVDVGPRLPPQTPGPPVFSSHFFGQHRLVADLSVQLRRAVSSAVQC